MPATASQSQTHGRDDLPLLVLDLSPGEAKDLPTGEPEIEVACVVGFAVAVELRAGDLDDDTMRRPAEVGAHSAARRGRRVIDLRGRHPRAAKRGQHEVLERRLGPVR